MSISRSWNWNLEFEEKESVWKNPALESYGLMHRWGSMGMKDFLDLGCGLGRHSILFARNSFSVSCLDLSAEAIESTRSRAMEEGLSLHCAIGDMLSLPYAGESFDCILCWNVISHSDTAGVRMAISEIHRVLRAGGECYLTLGSKSAWGWQQDWPLLDENTRLRMEEGPEYKVPHFYADRKLLDSLFAEYDIIGITHMEDWGSNNRGIHYHVHIRK